MDSEVSQWLREHYRPAPSEGPAAKKQKFEEIQRGLTSEFPSRKIQPATISRTIKSVFPDTISKPAGKSRQKHIFGLEAISEGSASTSSANTDLDLTAELRKEREEKKQLLDRVKILEERVAQLEQEQTLPFSQLSREIKSVVVPVNAAYHGPDTPSHFEDFSIDAVVSEFSCLAPNVYHLLKSLGNCEAEDDTVATNEVKVVTCMSILLKCQSYRVLGVQLLLTLMLLARATSRQAISVLNHAGVCVSYKTAWNYLQQLTLQACYHEVLQSGHWLWVFDNLNIRQAVRHEREDRHSTMMNITSRLAIRLRYLPQDPVHWSSTQPQRSRESLTITDFLPSEDDATELKQRATEYIMRFLVQEFKDLEKLQQFAPEPQPLHCVQKTEAVPMKALFKDEKYISETIDILSKLMEDSGFRGTSQIVVGDQLTCKNIRASKRWRQPEIHDKDRLNWAKEVPGDFHFLWECLRVLFIMFWGIPAQPGSLCNLREVIRRTQVDKSVKIFNVGDEFLMHAFKAHLTASILTSLGLSSTSDPVTHTTTRGWLQQTAEKLVTSLLIPEKFEDPVYNLHRAFLHHAFLYVDLRQAIRWENGPQIIRHWKYWLPRFLATGRKNYATESVHLICNLCADFPAHMAYIAIHNRTVNMQGKPGRGKPVDQLIEHYNLVLKQTLRSAGSNLTIRHVEEVSMSVLFLLEAAKKTDRAFQSSPQSIAHAVRSSQMDIVKMTQHLLDQNTTSAVNNRITPQFIDPTEQGWKKLSTTSWLHDRLSASQQDEPDDVEKNLEEEEIDLDYELSDVV